MQCKKIEPHVLDEFVNHHDYANYIKTYAYGFTDKLKGERVLPLGFFMDGSLIGTAMVVIKRNVFGTQWYLPGGICIDPFDAVLTKKAYDTLVAYARPFNVTFIRMEPDIEHQEHFPDGQINEAGFNNDDIRQRFEAWGWQHRGYNYGYGGNIQNRFTIIKDLKDAHDETDFVNALHPNHRSRYRKSLRRFVFVEKAGKDQLYVLHNFAQELAKKQHFKPKSVAYFESLLDNYGDHAFYFVCYVDLKRAILTVKEEIRQAQESLDGLDASKSTNVGRIKEFKRTIDYLQDELQVYEQTNHENGDMMSIGAAIFVTSGRNTYNLYSYTDPGQLMLNPAINMHMFALSFFSKLGIHKYDFVGVSGSTDKNDPFYGLYLFKHRFGGDFIEYLGEFDYVFKQGAYTYYLKWHAFKRRVARRFIRLYYQRVVK